MLKYIKQFFAFLFPIVSKAVIRVAADELSKRAYPPKPNKRMMDYAKYDVGLTESVYDRSDCDSAVFVTKGKQAEARELLRKHGLVS